MAKHTFTKEEREKGNKYTSGRRAVENGRKGGINSQKVQSIAKRRKEMFKTLAGAETTEKNAEMVRKTLGLDDDEIITNDDLMTMSVYQLALKGDGKAREQYYQMTEETKEDEQKKYELPLRVVGSAFVNLDHDFAPNLKYVIEGGRGSFKSSYISLKITELIKNNPRMHACIVRQVAGTLQDSVYAQMTWAINELGLTEEFEFKKSPLEIIYKKTGQIIFFRGADDPVKLKSIKPPFGYIGILWKEEADQLKGAEAERSINQSVLRGDGEEFYDIMSYNPPKSKDAWVNKELQIPDARRVVHHSTYLQAYPKWLGEKFLSDAEHLKEVNPSAYEHEYLGVPNGAGGNVFENVEVRELTDEEIARFDRIYQGADFGWYPDPYAFTRTHYDADTETIYVFDELYVNKQSNQQTGQWIIDKGYDDYRVICDSAEPKSVNDYRDMGINARGAIKGAGSVEYGFKFLQCRHIVVDPVRCPNSTHELLTYEYERDKEGNVVSGYPDGNDHFLSALRYAYEPIFNKRGYSA